MLRPKNKKTATAKSKEVKYEGFNYVKTLTGVTKEIDGEKHFFNFHDTYQKIYKASKNFDVAKLDEVVPAILDNKNVNGVLVVFEVTFDDTGETTMVSNYINPELMERIYENEETVFEYVGKRLQLGDTKYRTLKFIYLRIIFRK